MLHKIGGTLSRFTIKKFLHLDPSSFKVWTCDVVIGFDTFMLGGLDDGSRLRNDN